MPSDEDLNWQEADSRLHFDTMSGPCQVLVRDTVGSTNRWAFEAATNGAASGTAFMAKKQTAGRGRAGRRWESPSGNLYVSLLQHVDHLPPEGTLTNLGFLAGVAVFDSCARVLGSYAARELQLKWPNDLLLAERKLAGILLESHTLPTKAGSTCVIIGMGINVMNAPRSDEVSAISLMEYALTPVDAEDLCQMVVCAYADWFALWNKEGFAPIRQAWLDRGPRIGAKISVRNNQKHRLHGRFLGLDTDGALMLSENDQTPPQRFTVADVMTR